MYTHLFIFSIFSFMIYGSIKLYGQWVYIKESEKKIEEPKYFFNGEKLMTIELNVNQYAISFRCPNCGEVFEKALQKGVIAEGRGGNCPTCGVADGQPNVGRFQVIKKNTELDPQASPYQGWQQPR